MSASSSSPRIPTTRCSAWAGRSPCTADRGDEVRVVVVTDGSSTQYPGDAEMRARKEDEALRAAAELGVTDYVHLDLPDMRLDTLAHVEVNRVVEEHVPRLRAAVVYTPHPDVNLDHRALFDSVAVATRPTPGQPVRRVLTYAPTSSTEWTPAPLNWFVPNWFVDVTATIERKVAAFAHYETRAARVPASAQRARDPGGRRVLRRELRLRARRAVRPRSRLWSRCNVRALARWPQLLIVLALLGATAAAFAVTERLKLERSPVTGTRVDRVFSPVCECARDVAVDLVRAPAPGDGDPRRSSTRTGASCGRSSASGASRRAASSYTWDGRDELGRVVPEGVYRPRVQLERNGRTIVLPNPIRVDTTAPTITLVACLAARLLTRRRRSARSGDRDLPDRRARPRRHARRRSATRAEQVPRQSTASSTWFGRVNGQDGPAGTYEIRLRAVDRAGNRSARTRAVTVRVRFVELSRERIDAVAGKRFSVRVSTDATLLRLALRGSGGVRQARRCSCCGRPETPGAYTLYVTVGGRAARAAVDVVALRPSDAAADRARGQPLGHDPAARGPRPLAGARDPGRVVLRPAARAPPRPDGRRATRFLDDVARIPTIRDVGADARRTSPRVPARGHADGRCDRGDLRGVRGEGRKAALGRQDADVHAPPRAPRAPLPGGPVRPPDPGRPRRRALVPRDAGGDVHAHVGAPDDARAVRVPLAQGGRRCAGARTARRLEPVPRGALRGARRRPDGAVAAICAFAEIPFEPAMLEYAGAVDVSAKPHQQRLLTAAHDGRSELARGDVGRGRRRLRGRSPETCSPSSATRSRPSAPPRPVRRAARACVRRAPRRVERVGVARCNARRSGGVATRGCRLRARHVAAGHGDETAVQREEVRLLRRDAGRVLARAGAATRCSPSETRSAYVRFSSVEKKT